MDVVLRLTSEEAADIDLVCAYFLENAKEFSDIYPRIEHLKEKTRHEIRGNFIALLGSIIDKQENQT